ncbi:MAG TPA: hypothetical protein VN911_03170, partial [Candidatus Acidoferrum sp.]|nr:hypothetical protein [Candidatus Acidoferrum sp.]
MRRCLLTFAALVSFALTAFSQAKHPFTFEDMMKLKRVSEPEVSPDGKWVIFSVVDVNLEANSKTPHIWIVPTAGGGADASSAQAERILIADQDGDRPRWSPDGKRFAFISTKEGGSQVWIAQLDGATGAVTGTHKLTSIATEASGELWSPDGKNILFTSDVYPECDGPPAEEAACNAKKLEEHEKSKVKAMIFDRLLYRHWNAYKEGKRSHIFVAGMDDCAGNSRASLDRTAEGGCPHMSVPRDLTPGDYDAPVFSLGGQDDYAFSPDGQEICYTSNHDTNEAASTNNDLWIVPVDGGFISGNRAYPIPAKDITADNPASDSTPLYSPDGRYIAYRAQQRPGYESDRFELMLYDRKAGEKKNLTEKLDSWVGTFVWSPDSKSIFFSSEDKGESPIYALDITKQDAPTVREIVRGFNDDLAVTGDGKIMLSTRMSIRSPNQIRRFVCLGFTRTCGLPDGEQLSHLNDAVLSQVAMSPLESFWFTGAHNDKVQGFLVKPPNF